MNTFHFITSLKQELTLNTQKLISFEIPNTQYGEANTLIIIGLCRDAIPALHEAFNKGQLTVALIKTADEKKAQSQEAFQEIINLASRYIDITFTETPDLAEKFLSSSGKVAYSVDKYQKHNINKTGKIHKDSNIYQKLAWKLCKLKFWLHDNQISLMGHRWPSDTHLFKSSIRLPQENCPQTDNWKSPKKDLPINEYHPPSVEWHEVFQKRIFQSSPLKTTYKSKKKILLLINIKQDLALVQPIVSNLQPETYEVWISTWAALKTTAAIEWLTKNQIQYKIISDKMSKKDFDRKLEKSIKAVFAATETNLPIHAWSNKIIKHAQLRGIQTATMQHGYENVGLNYFDKSNPAGKVKFSSDNIFTWSDPSMMPSDSVPDETRRKLIQAGYPKPIKKQTQELSCALPSGRPIIAVFENLHWDRYSDEYRRKFITSLKRCAESYPDVLFVLKPHSAGLWSTRAGKTGTEIKPNNIMLIDPIDKFWQRYVAEDLLPHVNAVISTPSTVVLDAAMHGVPVAVYGHNYDLTNYPHLDILRTDEDWDNFIRSITSNEAKNLLLEKLRNFKQHTAIEENGAKIIAEKLESMTLEEGKPQPSNKTSNT